MKCGGRRGQTTVTISRRAFFKLVDVSQQFVEVRDSDEVPAEHLVRSQCRLLAGQQANQHAGDDRAVGLDVDAVSRTAEQVPDSRAIASCLTHI